MCGLVGVVDWNGLTGSTHVDRALAWVEHRGPDDRATERDTWYHVGHVRLSVIDLSARGRQPMLDSSRRFLTVYNGEIYNFESIDRRLEREGHLKTTGTDTETLLNSFCEFGVECFTMFRGMFAGAILDLHRRSLFLFRDRMGVKPIFYAQHGHNVMFASSARGVQALLGNPKPSRERLFNYLSFRSAGPEGSFIDGIRQVKPGTVIEFSSQGARIHEYWSLAAFFPGHADPSTASAPADIRAAITRAVERRLVADVSVGTFLSGGLDSTVILDRMTESSRSPTRAYTFGSLDHETDEAHAAARTAALYGAEFTQVPVDLAGYPSELRHLQRIKSAPLTVPNEWAIYQLSRQLRKTSTVVLSGEGADELFLGYSRIFRAAAAQDCRAPLAKPEMACWIFAQYRYVREQALLSVGFNESSVAEIANQGRAYILALLLEIEDPTMLGNVHYFFLRHHLPTLLDRLDNATMAASVEGRAPFTDHELVEAVLQSAGSRRHEMIGKRQLYEAFDHLPSWVLGAEKVGFKLGDTLPPAVVQPAVLRLVGLDPDACHDSARVTTMEKWHLTMLAIYADEHGLHLTE